MVAWVRIPLRPLGKKAFWSDCFLVWPRFLVVRVAGILRDDLMHVDVRRMIDILVPCLGRPQNAQSFADSLDRTATVPYCLLFLTSPGDHAQLEACKATGANVL